MVLCRLTHSSSIALKSPLSLALSWLSWLSSQGDDEEGLPGIDNGEVHTH